MTTLPEWNILSEYPAIQSSEFLADFAEVEKIVKEISQITKENQSIWSLTEWPAEQRKTIAETMVQIWSKTERAWILAANMQTFCHCHISVDANDSEAEKGSSRLQILLAHLQEACTPAELWMIKCSDSFSDEILEQPELNAWKFYWQKMRLNKDLLLSQSEEILLNSLRVSGHQAWGDLYTKLMGTITCEIEINGQTETVGIAKAQAITMLPDPVARKAAWQAVQKAWGLHKESAAAILNALAGWRLELIKKRSHTRQTNFLEAPLQGACIKESTLNAMMTAIHKNAPRLQKTLKIMAKLHGHEKMQIWDLLAPAPLKSESDAALSFEEGFQTISSALQEVDSELYEFVTMMREKKWIESRILPRKSGGAYCTGFAKSRTPRVFQTWMGSFMDLTTLAHELGHAFHSWVMRDLPFIQRDYPMTLAETASIFTETVLLDSMMHSKKLSAKTRFTAAYAEVENAVALLLNIPARFDFEKSLYEKRSQSTLTAEELSQLTDEAWTKWYGNALEQNDKLFWATKLHFSMSEVSFYNFPYAFGYLFSLSIYARRKEWGADFIKKYKEILCDTGRMSAEELVQKHMNEDLSSVSFWQKSIDIVNEKLEHFEELARA